VLFTPPAVIIPQMFADGNPFPFQVVNANGGLGGDFDPNVQIFVVDLNTGALVTQSIGPGFSPTSDQPPNFYPIAEPAGSTPTPGAGTVVYNGGLAIAGQFDPNNPTQRDPSRNWSLAFSHTFTPDPLELVLPPGGADGLARLKIAENNSPDVRDRFYFSYNFYNDVLGGYGDVNRYTFGFEKRVGPIHSFGLRVPFASTLDSDLSPGGIDLIDTRLGNVNLFWKSLLMVRENWLLSGGVALTVPSADDTRVYLANGQQLLHIENESLHVLPYLGLLVSPGGRFYFQGFVQLDFDTEGNPVWADPAGGGLSRVGTLQDTNLLYVDFGIGYRIFSGHGSGITGIAPFAELHYTTTLQDADAVIAGPLVVNSSTNRFDVLNLSLGTHVVLGNSLTVSPGLVVPLRDGDDQEFDYEAGVQANLRF
jgi:hypothetical protein